MILVDKLGESFQVAGMSQDTDKLILDFQKPFIVRKIFDDLSMRSADAGFSKWIMRAFQ